MENLLFIKSEIVTLLLSFLYIIYYISSKMYNIYFKVKNKIKPQKIKKRKTALNKVNLNLDNKKKVKTYNKNNIKDTDLHKLNEIIKKVRINSTKGYFDSSKNLIVEGLSIDKYNKDLNLELASIYEKEKNYVNAEYVYKDLLESHKGDYDIMKKLGYNLAVQNKLTESLLMYELLHTKNKGDYEVIEIIADLSFTLEEYKKALKYSMLYLSSKPRDIDKLSMKAICLQKLKRFDESIDAYNRIIELQPYNTKAKENLELVIQEKNDNKSNDD